MPSPKCVATIVALVALVETIAGLVKLLLLAGAHERLPRELPQRLLQLCIHCSSHRRL